MEKKVTKRENFEAIIAVLNEAGREDLAKVVAHEIELLDNKAAKAKAKKAYDRAVVKAEKMIAKALKK